MCKESKSSETVWSKVGTFQGWGVEGLFSETMKVVVKGHSLKHFEFGWAEVIKNFTCYFWFFKY